MASGRPSIYQDGEIRTHDFSDPNGATYQTGPHPVRTLVNPLTNTASGYEPTGSYGIVVDGVLSLYGVRPWRSFPCHMADSSFMATRRIRLSLDNAYKGNHVSSDCDDRCTPHRLRNEDTLPLSRSRRIHGSGPESSHAG